MVIDIELNTDHEVVWSIPETNTFLTANSPKVTVELDQLTERQKYGIAIAYMLGKVHTSVPFHEVYKEPENKDVMQKQPTQTKQAEPAESVALKAKELLSESVTKIKKELLITKDIRLIKLMLALEEGNQRRPTVIKALRDKMNTVEKSIKQSVESSDGQTIKMIDPSATVRGKATIVYDVVESNEKVITVQVPKGE